MFTWFEKRLPPFPDAPIEAPPERLFAFLWYFLKPAWPLLAIVAGLSALIAILEVATFSFMGTFVDWLTNETRAGFMERNGPIIIGMVVFIGVLVPLVHLTWELVFHQGFVANFPMAIRWRAHRYLLNQSISFFQDDMAGRVSTTLMQTALAVREALTRICDVLVYFSVYILSSLVLMATSDWRLALPLFVWCITYGLTLWVYIPRLGEVSEEQADARAVMTGRIVDSYTNIMTVKLFAHSRAESAYARASMEPFLDTVYRQMRTVTILNSLLHFQNNVALAATALAGVVLWQYDLVSVGAIAVAIALVLRMHGMAQWILWEMSSLFEAIGTVRDGSKLMAKPIGVVDRPGARDLVAGPGAIRFEAVRFGYGKPRGALDGLTLTIAPGEKVGIVGRSGAGKSTLVSVLLRLHDLEAGRILVDGQDVAGVTQESLRGAIGVVTQDTALLNRSIADNIRYGRPQADLDTVVAAATAAHAHDFIVELEDAKGRKGYDAHVGERGVKLSGGQRQRIAIARVFLKNAPILVLDEATSALDSEVEAAIQENLVDLARGKTVIAIAHRLSTIAAMDRLVVLDQGRVVEDGTHAELLARGGIYADLWARQSGGFLGVADPSLSSDEEREPEPVAMPVARGSA